MIDSLLGIKEEAQQSIARAGDFETLNAIRVKTLGRKGEITQVLRGLKDLDAGQKVEVGRIANEVKDGLEKLIEAKTQQLKARQLETALQSERLDITLPGRPGKAGGRHTISQVTAQITAIFTGMGFTVAEGPEVELDYYNFEALNVPRDHPARDMQDTFYITEDMPLRTHTSPVQVRTMEKMAPQIPVKIIVPGRVYRKDDDATHSPMFHQVEGLLIDEHITFANLKAMLMLFARQIFGSDVKVRYRPSFFPFTEPSVEMDISCVNCGGEGCGVCKQTGWLEILGAGMVHPRVLEYGGYHPEKHTGFAFGMGIERIAMLKYKINDMRLLFDNDKRFLKQF
ncbi:MAG: phenylalanine--tRNA ligase subunit alpha [Syntrophomonadaceae bacterium]